MENYQFENIEKELEELRNRFSRADLVLNDLENIQSQFEWLGKTCDELNKSRDELNKYLEKVKHIHNECLKKRDELNEYLVEVKQLHSELSKIPQVINQPQENFEEPLTLVREENELKLEVMKSQVIENVSTSSMDLIIQEPDNTQSVKKLPDPLPSEQEMEKFVPQLLRVVLESKADEQVVHSFLRKNLDKLNDRFPEVLQNWANTTLPKVRDSKKQEFLNRITVMSSLIRTFDGGVRGTNLEIARTGYNIVASISKN
ncbi:hypothetical protein [Okeania sp. SIO1I7]|uniref:hypothetical protein n=1 Tax=Okeania sp. SIO1I7 TaxID=2607772 RepID=UPI0013FB01E3|nr:hypothetical protein [Okeania sp. SIO1I7]NET29887.1 hypothetical protein [Okeania sp. SIO1I7]